MDYCHLRQIGGNYYNEVINRINIISVFFLQKKTPKRFTTSESSRLFCFALVRAYQPLSTLKIISQSQKPPFSEK